MKSGWLPSTVATSDWKLAADWPLSRLAWVILMTPGAAGAGALPLPAGAADAAAEGAMPVRSSRATAGEDTTVAAPTSAAIRSCSPAAWRRARVRRAGRGWEGDTGEDLPV